jgi:hypothetical protein
MSMHRLKLRGLGMKVPLVGNIVYGHTALDDFFVVLSVNGLEVVRRLTESPTQFSISSKWVIRPIRFPIFQWQIERFL